LFNHQLLGQGLSHFAKIYLIFGGIWVRRSDKMTFGYIQDGKHRQDCTKIGFLT